MEEEQEEEKANVAVKEQEEKESAQTLLHILLTTAAIKAWRIRSGDVKSAHYLQKERLDSEVRDQDPPERGTVKIEKVLERLGCEKVKPEYCLFTYKLEGKLEVIILIQNDNIFYAGTEKFGDKVMRSMEREYLTGRTEEETLTYTGLAIEKKEKGITLDQINYVKEKITPIDLKLGDTKRLLDKEEKKLLQRLTGQLNWMAMQSRPDISYTVMELRSKIKTAQLENLKIANKTTIKLATSPMKMLFPKMEGKLQVVTYSDAAFRNLPGQVNSGENHLIFLNNKEEKEAAPIAWKSNKVKRVVGSTVAAEAPGLLKKRHA